jgi:hypothetical protein
MITGAMLMSVTHSINDRIGFSLSKIMSAAYD